MKIIVLLVSLLSCLQCQAAANGNTISEVKITQGIVYFSTATNKPGTRPGCVATQNAQKWAFSVETTQGRHLYRALLAASTSASSIVVTSANDCNDAAGYERPAAIAVELL